MLRPACELLSFGLAWLNRDMEEGVFLNTERVRLLGGPSATLSCMARARVSRLAVGPSAEGWSAFVGLMLSVELERVLLLSGSSRDCISMAFATCCVPGQIMGVG